MADDVIERVVAEEAERVLWHRRRDGRYDLSDMGHDRLMESLRRVAKAILATETGEVCVEVSGGVVVDVSGLPAGWTWRLNDDDISE